MTVKTNVQLKADLDANIDTNGNNEITGSVLNAYETDLLYSKVSLIDNEIIQGTKLFSSFPQSAHSAPTDDYEFANKKYVDDNEVDGLWGDDGTDVTLITPRDVDLGDNTIDTKRLLQSNNGNSIFIGEDAGLNDDLTDNRNTYVGYFTGKMGTTAWRNIGIGWNALALITIGSRNVVMGAEAGYNITSGFNNTAIGDFALISNSIGNYNTAIGEGSLTNTTGNKNVGIGSQTATSLTTGTLNTYIGSNVVAGSPIATNEIVIGANAIGNGSNTVTLGNTSVTDVYMASDSGATVHAGQYRLSALNTAPASAAAAGTLGEIRVDANHIYVCTATDTWKRTALTTW